jgi:hypothetical protein
MIRRTICHLWSEAGAEWILKILLHTKMALVRCSDRLGPKLPWFSLLDIVLIIEHLLLHLCNKCIIHDLHGVEHWCDLRIKQLFLLFLEENISTLIFGYLFCVHLLLCNLLLVV